MTESYYYARTEEYRQILDRKKIGVHQVNDGGEVTSLKLVMMMVITAMMVMLTTTFRCQWCTVACW